jgi:ergothioneine biosynthesis protein EgtB
MSTATQSPTRAGATLLARFRAVRATTLAFTAPLSPEDMMVQSCTEASPVKWHLAHTTWFFETFVLTPFAPAYKPFHQDFHWLFNSYYNSLGDMPAKSLRASFSRPPLADILAYRAYVDRAIAALLEEDSAANEFDILSRITLGLEHEQQHLELIATDIKHALFTNPLHPAYTAAYRPPEPRALSPEPSFQLFPGGLIEIGTTPDPTDPLAFAFDNETPRHQVFLQPCQLANRLVTVRDYLAFIDDNGYTRPELWLSEGWTTMRNQGWQAPLYWTRNQTTESGWVIFTLHGFGPLEAQLETPVCHLSFFEADAFARWSGCRLPTELEWEHAAGTVLPSLAANMLESGNLHPSPLLSSRSVAEGPASVSGPHQMYGDVWEWTASPYTGYPGYKPLPGALGEYNGKFMSSQFILRGGSCVTPATHIRATYRNFFHPATRWQFSGLRLAKDL